MKILLTGAAQGLGLATASEALERGHQVMATVRDIKRIGHLQELSNKYSQQLDIVQLDVNDEREIREARLQIEQKHGHIDALINNAGILIARDQKLEQLDFKDMELTMQTNLYGPMKVAKHFLPLLRKSNQPCIINISSEAGCFSAAYGADYPYALSKCGLTFFTAQLRKELAPQGFVVYSVHPGWIKTQMGGDRAPGHPQDTAVGLLNLAERKIQPEQESWMINHKGEAMPY
ncbi:MULTISPECIES: SDR family NAD(P)-dependent oxidoreductase [unclassified Paenibacillus]|uniref:SDR family NAD(P)-dependent oxidoreductase n=1 Tax=unclassified Paenibacillus TaxID=185978 RepID=UPI0008395015|nr:MULTISPECIES: SDR family NAD(P)-dependent oxidoreductase [unclassified Paenibacillus]NWL89294.1 KR domain-containing protein [Paenibacillus sp. 79R4]